MVPVMNWFTLLWRLHRWFGAACGLILLLTSVTGVLLLVKKDYAYLQPPTVRGEPGPASALQPLPAIYEAVFALGLPQFRTEADIARIDFRPAQRLHKVISVHDHCEVQVCATTLRTSGPAVRRSDWIETLHDGSWFGERVHGWLMPTVGATLAFLSLSGYVMWLWPKWKRRRKRAPDRPFAPTTGAGRSDRAP